MKNINIYIKEAIDTENLFWKINTWFQKNEPGKNEFSELVKSYKGKKANPADLEKYLGDTGKDPKPFIDFLNDELPSDNESRDYVYLLSKVIDTINANKVNSI